MTLGFRTARNVVRLGRDPFFPGVDKDIPIRQSAILNADDLIPQFGFVGEQYESKRVLLLGINPGNGPKNDKRTARDARMMPELGRFFSDPTELTFSRASCACMEECQQWPMWKRHCSEVIGAGRLLFNEIAYTNCLPWRTASESKFDKGVASKAVKLYLEPFIEELNPTVIVALGKRASVILNMTNDPEQNVVVWNRAQAARASVLQDRAIAAQRIFEIVGRIVGTHPSTSSG